MNSVSEIKKVQKLKWYINSLNNGEPSSKTKYNI